MRYCNKLIELKRTRLIYTNADGKLAWGLNDEDPENVSIQLRRVGGGNPPWFV
jgi:hypothetical protein